MEILSRLTVCLLSSPPEVFEATQKRLILNKRQGGQRANGLTPDEAPRFWLTGKLYYGKCGTPMQGCSGTSGHGGATYYYYACGAARKKKCSLKYVKKDKIEAIACFMLSECLKDTELLASLAVDVAAYYQKEHEDKGYIEGLKAERAEAEKALNNLARAIEQGIFSERTQTRLLELEGRKKALTEAIEAEEIKRAVTKNEISIQHFFDEYKNADLNDSAVRDYLLDYFVDKIFVYDDKVVLTAWYGNDKKEITWGDIDCVVVKDRKRKKRSSASGSVPNPASAPKTAGKETGPVFCGPEGALLTIGADRALFYRVLEQCGVPNPILEINGVKRRQSSPQLPPHLRHPDEAGIRPRQRQAGADGPYRRRHVAPLSRCFPGEPAAAHRQLVAKNRFVIAQKFLACPQNKKAKKLRKPAI